MKKAIVAKKIGMTQVFNQETGEMIPVTVLEAGPCVVTQVKTVEHDGYSAVQVGFGETREKLVNKPDQGQFKKAGVEVMRMLEELKLDDAENYKVGDVIKADMFAVGDKIDASGVSKGKGYQGAIHRHGFGRGPMEHGSKYHRHAGSLGSSTTPGRVFKGKKLPGHMGNVERTVQNLEIVRVDAEQNLLLVRGSVPGPKKAVITLVSSVKA